ncbi:MAG: DUF362 domain-containing protein [Anaerolineales bacterium]
MPTSIPRRTFLRLLALGVGSAACSRMGSALEAVTPSPSRTAVGSAPTASLASHVGPPPSPVPSPIPATATSVPLPDLVVARGGTPEAMVQRALSALGGASRFVRPGANVIIKPNICVNYRTYDYAATTNPWVVGELVRQCRAAGASRVRVMDFPFGGDAPTAYIKSGIQDQVVAAGGEMEYMPSYKFVKVDLPAAKDLHTCQIFDDILNADVLINVPIAKDHSTAGLTLGMKNLMGTILDRSVMHVDAAARMGQRLADLAGRIRPSLTVIDAVRILVKDGPQGAYLSDVLELGTVIMSADIVAADTYATGLFPNRTADQLAFARAHEGIDAAEAMGLGRSDLASLKIEEISVGT